MGHPEGRLGARALCGGHRAGALASSHYWAYSTVKTTMDRMVAKGLLVTKPIRNLTLFSARISRTDAQRSELRRHSPPLTGHSTPLIQFLVEEEELTNDEIAEASQTDQTAGPFLTRPDASRGRLDMRDLMNSVINWVNRAGALSWDFAGGQNALRAAGFTPASSTRSALR